MTVVFDGRADAASLAKLEPLFAPLVESNEPPVFDIVGDVYRSVLRSVVYQQLNGNAASTILGRVLALFGGAWPEPAELLERSDDELRAAGLSRAKVKAVKATAEAVLAGELEAASSPCADEETIRQALLPIRGVGPWTVDMVLIFGLGHRDILPTGDYGVRKGFQLLFGLEELPSPAQMIDRAEAWSGIRSTAAWYLWRAADTLVPSA